MPILNGTAFDDRIEGTDAADTINGLQGNDLLLGQGGADLLNGGAGDDRLFGLRGNDVLRGKSGNDRLNGGEGVNGGDDRLFGDVGDDRLFGGDGRDHLFGGADDDTIIGHLGADLLNGGSGSDFFEFRGKIFGHPGYDSGIVAGERDRITDFDRGEGDKLDFRLSPEVDRFVGTGPVGEGEVGYRERGGLTIIAGNDDADAAPEFEIEILGTGLGLSAADFLFS